MTDTTSAPEGDVRAGEAEWLLPVLILVPASAIRHFSDHSTPWLVISWACCALSAVVLALGWQTVIRHGMRNLWAWVTCALAHLFLATQMLWLTWG